MVTLIYLESLVYGLLFAHGYVYLRWLCIVVVLNDIVLRIVTVALVSIVLPTIIVVSLLVRVVIF